jgi:very-short-patch-repair endonuclease
MMSAVDRFLVKEARRKPRDRVPPKQRVQSEHEATFELQIRADRLPAYNREWKFCERGWRFDFAWPALRLAVEIEGGIYTNGRHNRGKGFEADCRKYLRATLMGWTVLRGTPAMVQSGELLNAAKEILQQRSIGEAA